MKPWMGIVAMLMVASSAAAEPVEDRAPRSAPPYTDYCSMLKQEIQGKKHAFLAGNLVYYVGGQYSVWDHQEDETLGLTHPFFHDLRGRGYGIVTNTATGVGHDLEGWEFYRNTKAAYGTVLIGNEEYPHPIPKRMYWQPDRVRCEYVVAGVRIQEEKFIATHDVVCTRITASAPIRIRFEGQSFVNDRRSVERTSTLRYDQDHNMIHVVEGGTALARPEEGVNVTGRLMYDGMSTVISASSDFSETFTGSRDADGRQQYAFTVPCGPDGVTVVWAMDDAYPDARKRAQAVLDDPAGHLADKTAAMNEMLNEQIPYFRCSDEQIVQIYYYLWSLYLMYYVDVDKGWEKYPHTQTAVNNFMGMHRFDANFQIPVGAWVKDKEAYAYGNVLIWSALLPHAQSLGRLPDNMGQSWYSPYFETAIEHVVGAWQVYEQSGDRDFLEQCYEPYFKPLFWGGTFDIWGARYDGAECLIKMAAATGNEADIPHWRKIMELDGRDEWMKENWQKDGITNFFGGLLPAAYPAGTKEKVMFWTGMAYMRNSWFPDDWAKRMTREWAVDSVKGFNGPVPLTLVAMQDVEHIFPDFASAPDLSYLSIIGMYRHNVGADANVMGLGHLKKYNWKWGMPVAPESYDSTWGIWGDQYSNFNAGKILLILEGIAGLGYSIPDDTFTVSDTMPAEWSFMETRVPVTRDGLTRWIRVRIDRTPNADGSIFKTVSVTGNPQHTLRVNPWLEEKQLVSGQPDGADDIPGRVGHAFTNRTEATVSVRLRP